ncbi:hypothetical protein [Synechococcus sp. CCY 9618]|uniref:hypothetical protein n=1 Tax=Synechococcus sp. CCY 9618 TaxID=2815602 RepID=UPI001C226F00|nr:hypothetical protein [Synechococcus sp. CCY 9618]
MTTPSLRFRPHGVGRFFVAGFLSLWLCAWSAGELFALWFLWTFLTTGQGPLAVVVFVLLWVSVWSWGGIVALTLVLRCLWSEDRLVLHDDGRLECLARLGPFRRRRALPWREILRFRVQAEAARGGALVAELPGRTLEITRLGNLRQRQEAAEQLNRALGPRPEPREPNPAPAVLPAGWQEVSPSFDSPLLVPHPGLRRRQSLAMGLVCLLVWGLLALLVGGALTRPALWVGVLVLGALGLACGWGLLWLLFGRREWRLEPRRLVLQRRFAGRLRTLGEARALQLTETIDSDGDRCYRLEATRSAGRPLTVDHSGQDPASLRSLGAWLAARAHVPFEDRVPTEAQRLERRTAELQRLRQQLTEAGPLGRWAAQLIDRDDAGRSA